MAVNPRTSESAQMNPSQTTRATRRRLILFSLESFGAEEGTRFIDHLNHRKQRAIISVVMPLSCIRQFPDMNELTVSLMVRYKDTAGKWKKRTGRAWQEW